MELNSSAVNRVSKPLNISILLIKVHFWIALPITLSVRLNMLQSWIPITVEFAIVVDNMITSYFLPLYKATLNLAIVNIFAKHVFCCFPAETETLVSNTHIEERWLEKEPLQVPLLFLGILLEHLLKLLYNFSKSLNITGQSILLGANFVLIFDYQLKIGLLMFYNWLYLYLILSMSYSVTVLVTANFLVRDIRGQAL
jgi:hypothetical protein